MSHCFLKEEATEEIIKNVAGFCAECYNEIVSHDIIFYDMNNYCYLCESCQNKFKNKIDNSCESIDKNNNLLFN